MPRPRWSVLLASAFAFVSVARVCATDTAAITTIRDCGTVHALSPESAAKKRPVELHGVVIVADYDGFILHDGEHGVYVRWRSGAVPKFGELVAVRGTTNAGDFAPAIQADAVDDLGPGRLPAPTRVTARDL